MSEQPWEKLRQTVRISNDAPEGEAVSSLEWRINHLERRLDTLESSLVKQLEQLTGAYQHVARAMDRMVERHEFEPIKHLVFVLCACMATGFVAALFTRAFMR